MVSQCHAAAKIGQRVLGAGGNAVDAAVATSFALSVVRPFSCGIGGGGFMVIYTEPTSDPARAARAIAINYRETAPACAVPDYFQKLDDPLASIRGGKACAVPGTVAGLLHALDRYGTLDRARILPEGRTSIDHARVGSEIVYRDESTKRETTITLVWPQDANIEKNRISVMTPIGVALIGMAAERSIDWTTRSGDVKRLTVLEVR